MMWTRYFCAAMSFVLFWALGCGPRQPAVNEGTNKEEECSFCETEACKNSCEILSRAFGPEAQKRLEENRRKLEEGRRKLTQDELPSSPAPSDSDAEDPGTYSGATPPAPKPLVSFRPGVGLDELSTWPGGDAEGVAQVHAVDVSTSHVRELLSPRGQYVRLYAEALVTGRAQASSAEAITKLLEPQIGIRRAKAMSLKGRGQRVLLHYADAPAHWLLQILANVMARNHVSALDLPKIEIYLSGVPGEAATKAIADAVGLIRTRWGNTVFFTPPGTSPDSRFRRFRRKVDIDLHGAYASDALALLQSIANTDHQTGCRTGNAITRLRLRKATVGAALAAIQLFTRVSLDKLEEESQRCPMFDKGALTAASLGGMKLVGIVRQIHPKVAVAAFHDAQKRLVLLRDGDLPGIGKVGVHFGYVSITPPKLDTESQSIEYALYEDGQKPAYGPSDLLPPWGREELLVDSRLAATVILPNVSAAILENKNGWKIVKQDTSRPPWHRLPSYYKDGVELQTEVVIEPGRAKFITNGNLVADFALQKRQK